MKKPTVVYTAGVWDLFHRGHLNLLWQSRQLGDVLIVGVVTDRGVLAYKDREPVDNLWERMGKIEDLPWVDMVMEQEGTDPSDNLRRIMPDVFTHGSDWERLKEGHDTLEELGIEYVSIPYTPGISTTILRGDE
jgi:glycerol-3-phosphate cytidylyltransferase